MWPSLEASFAANMRPDGWSQCTVKNRIWATVFTGSPLTKEGTAEAEGSHEHDGRESSHVLGRLLSFFHVANDVAHLVGREDAVSVDVVLLHVLKKTQKSMRVSANCWRNGGVRVSAYLVELDELLVAMVVVVVAVLVVTGGGSIKACLHVVGFDDLGHS